MSIVSFIGDIHGDFVDYYKIIEQKQHSIQVGDLGVGFKFRDPNTQKISTCLNPDGEFLDRHDARFITGNHDNPSFSQTLPYYIPHGTIEINNGAKIMYIGGAWSIDRAYRTEGLDWWEDEELSYAEFNNLITIYEQEKPNVMVTHDAPQQWSRTLASNYFILTRTGQAFGTMLEIHGPNMWIHGHWHTERRGKIGVTEFISLGIKQVFDVTF